MRRPSAGAHRPGVQTEHIPCEHSYGDDHRDRCEKLSKTARKPGGGALLFRRILFNPFPLSGALSGALSGDGLREADAQRLVFIALRALPTMLAGIRRAVLAQGLNPIRPLDQ